METIAMVRMLVARKYMYRVYTYTRRIFERVDLPRFEYAPLAWLSEKFEPQFSKGILVK
jgi:hypothetical protein